ncbi:uncharacterized protein BCR38DRAFT_408901 [Pseudomassariella vexata]|uniref:Uncharacterized protein n=1 Tax=Pseudomassariella vexata TaxID=1141098 RepID=A0A1Y2E1F1_9PEZI|nr:uncharacterized protein BCR38DRAFT_408901 [Pseudomassariella vexata]ORY65166.1 hypothetical protein BCR38DRAFT_408901 [Pseudomassariella vexata]
MARGSGSLDELSCAVDFDMMGLTARMPVRASLGSLNKCEARDLGLVLCLVDEVSTYIIIYSAILVVFGTIASVQTSRLFVAQRQVPHLDFINDQLDLALEDFPRAAQLIYTPDAIASHSLNESRQNQILSDFAEDALESVDTTLIGNENTLLYQINFLSETVGLRWSIFFTAGENEKVENKGAVDVFQTDLENLTVATEGNQRQSQITRFVSTDAKPLPFDVELMPGFGDFICPDGPFVLELVPVGDTVIDVRQTIVEPTAEDGTLTIFPLGFQILVFDDGHVESLLEE